MEQNLLTKKKLKEKSIEYQIPFADLLEVFLQETLMFQILETGFAKRLWLKDREDFSIDGYRKEWQKPLHFVYGQDDGKEQQVLDEKWITDFAEGNPSLENIEDDEEYEVVSDRFDELLDEAEFEDLDD